MFSHIDRFVKIVDSVDRSKYIAVTVITLLRIANLSPGICGRFFVC